MKKLFFVLVFAICGLAAFAKQPTVAVASFDIQAGSGITKEEAGVVYELFIAELVSTGAVTVVDRVNLDRILAEMKFQTTDWSNPVKTVALGKVLNAEIIVQGRFMKMGESIYWVVTMLDLNTAAIYASSRTQMKNIGEAWNVLPNFCKQLVDKIKNPVSNAPGIPTIAVSTFDVQGGITPAEAEVVTELFIGSLVARNDAKVVDRVNFDKIMTEMKFQTTDWSDKEKTAKLGKVLNAGVVIRGQLMKMGSNIFWTTTVLDVNTAQILASSRQQLSNLNELWEKNLLANATQQITAQLPPPNFFVGRWQATEKVNGEELVCILNIKADGTVVVERYDTITKTRNHTIDGGLVALATLGTILTLGFTLDDALRTDYDKYKTTYSSPNRNGKGNGTYSLNRNSSDTIGATFSCQFTGITSGMPDSSDSVIKLRLGELNSFSVDARIPYEYEIYQESGKTKSQKANTSSGYSSFTKVK